MMQPEWFKSRGYKHFDAPVGSTFAIRIGNGQFLEHHSWLPLISRTKSVKRYKPKKGKTEFKDRTIMYASHRDACILTKYAFTLTHILDNYYNSSNLGESVIAYRKLSKSNYNFSADAYRCAMKHAPCIVSCFDIEGFFDNLDHSILKERLKIILKVEELPKDWYAVFRHVTRYSHVCRSDLLADLAIGPRFAYQTHKPLATIAEVKGAGIKIYRNENCFGIPQGTPISSVFANLYMIDVDGEMVALCHKCGALYQRYSDDILIICKAEDEKLLIDMLRTAIFQHRLNIKEDKTERILFKMGTSDTFQYLGFNISSDGAVIRPSSLAKQWRKAIRSIRRTQKIGHEEIAKGKAAKIYTKKLWRRFYPVGVRNFSAYTRRAAKVFNSKRMVRQMLRLERFIQRELVSLNPRPTSEKDRHN